MTKKLQEQLYKKYPKIFAQKDLPKTESPMYWGILCGDGWYVLLDVLCGTIKRLVDSGKIKSIEATQVKQKFGGLRFYYEPHNEELDSIIEFAEILSYYICEHCGMSDSSVVQTKGYVLTLCKNCRSKND